MTRAFPSPKKITIIFFDLSEGSNVRRMGTEQQFLTNPALALEIVVMKLRENRQGQFGQRQTSHLGVGQDDDESVYNSIRTEYAGTKYPSKN